MHAQSMRIHHCEDPRAAATRSSNRKKPNLSRVRARRSRWLGDQPRAALAGEIRPEPLVLHAQPVLQLRQREDVNERPDEPGHKAACPQRAALQYRVILADDGHVALIEIAER